jgi:hypothetical protein
MYLCLEPVLFITMTVTKGPNVNLNKFGITCNIHHDPCMTSPVDCAIYCHGRGNSGLLSRQAKSALNC